MILGKDFIKIFSKGLHSPLWESKNKLQKGFWNLLTRITQIAL